MALSALPLFHRVQGQRVVVLGEGPAADARRRLVERSGGICCGEPEAHHARLAFVAIDEERAAEAAAIRLRCRGLLVNVTDRPALCDFTVPSVIERDPLLVAIGTAGASAGLAKHVRLRLEAILPQSLGALALALSSARDRLRARWPDPGERRRALDAALVEGAPLDPLSGADAESVGRWLDDPAAADPSRRVDIQLTSDDPDDLTLRAARLLGAADAIVHDAAVSPAILARARADARRFEAGSTPAQVPGLVVVVHAPA